MPAGTDDSLAGTGDTDMAISSMTGFSRADGAHGDFAWHWEIKSVNGKALDVRSRLPSGLEAVEGALRETAARHLRRGNLQAALQLSRETTAPSVQINEQVLDTVLDAAGRLRQRLDAPPVTVEGILALRGVMELAEPQLDEDELTARNDAILRSFDRACADLAAARKDEGKKLAEVIAAQIDEIERLATAARDNPTRTPDAIRKRLSEQVARLADTATPLDPDRLHQEAMLMAAKADVQEELDRLFAHVNAARHLLKSDEPVGRKFDFLAQEFNREANTLCSKATDPSLTATGLELKVVIDQLREQVQNVE
jgi:uncharacterized protein (TIGR00255 family)